MGFLDTDTETKAEVRLDDGDHERFAHYAEKNEIMEALVNGVPVVALCGKIWVPSRDPKKFPICPMCKEIYDALFLTD
jgi:glutaredoxin